MKDCTDDDIVTDRFEIARQMEDTVDAPVMATLGGPDTARTFPKGYGTQSAPMTATEVLSRKGPTVPEVKFDAVIDKVLGLCDTLQPEGNQINYQIGYDRGKTEYKEAILDLLDACNRQPPNNVQPGDWLNSLTSAERKDCPIYSGVIAYFPDALAAVARHSKQGNDKHNPGEPLHWARGKSMDQEDCIARHLAGVGKRDSADGTRHSVGLAWRALALLQLEIEAAVSRGEKV